MALQMLRDFAENIKAAVIYTVFVDERGVVLDREQLVPCIRWFDGSLQAHREFTDLHTLPNTTSEQTVVVI